MDHVSGDKLLPIACLLFIVMQIVSYEGGEYSLSIFERCKLNVYKIYSDGKRELITFDPGNSCRQSFTVVLLEVQSLESLFVVVDSTITKTLNYSLHKLSYEHLLHMKK